MPQVFPDYPETCGICFYSIVNSNLSKAFSSDERRKVSDIFGTDFHRLCIVVKRVEYFGCQLDVDFLAVASFYVYTQESLQRFDRPFRIVRIFDVDLCDFVTIHFAGVGNVERQCDRLVFGNLAEDSFAFR